MISKYKEEDKDCQKALHSLIFTVMATPNIKISEEGLAKLREELSSEEMRIGLARIQELLLSMKATEHNNEEAKKMLGLTDEELAKLDDDIDMDHGALYLKIELTLKDQFKMTDTKNLNRVMRLVSAVCGHSCYFNCTVNYTWTIGVCS